MYQQNTIRFKDMIKIDLEYYYNAIIDAYLWFEPSTIRQNHDSTPKSCVGVCCSPSASLTPFPPLALR